MEKTRWQQRLKNYTKELSQLEAFLKQESLNALEEQGLIQAFEYTHELAWKTQKSFLESRGVSDIFGSKEDLQIEGQCDDGLYLRVCRGKRGRAEDGGQAGVCVQG